MIAKRVNIIFFNFLRGFAPSLFNFFIALIGFQSCGAENWGEFAGVILILFVFNFIANWGNKEYLIRTYSEKPNEIKLHYAKSLTTRALFLALSIPLLLYYDSNIALLSILLIIVRFLYSSFESLIIYQQAFKMQLIAELTGFVLILSAIFFNKSFSIEYFLFVYLVSNLVKLVLLTIYLKPFGKRDLFHFDFSILVLTLPFFLISLSGWLHSRIDLYIVEFHLGDTYLAKYQILMGAYLLLDALSAFIVQPFSKHIYRLKDETLKKIRFLLMKIGLPLVLMGSFSIYIFLNFFTTVEFSNLIYFIMTIGAIPPFFYMIDVFILYRRKQEKLIMRIGFLGAGLNLLLALILIPKVGILGAIIGATVAKFILLTAPYFVKKGASTQLN